MKFESLLILIDGFREKNYFAKVIMGDKFRSGIITTRRSRIEKKVKINKIIVEDDLLGNVKEQYSSWLKVKRIITLVLRLKINIEPKKKMMSTR